ncbi:MAG: hypothetical protein ICV68_16660 [Pyrinomonadaceae bacterium]|nr:hypothetical protein [Pyrinomonadaceae bacterium]
MKQWPGDCLLVMASIPFAHAFRRPGMASARTTGEAKSHRGIPYAPHGSVSVGYAASFTGLFESAFTISKCPAGAMLGLS